MNQNINTVNWEEQFPQFISHYFLLNRVYLINIPYETSSAVQRHKSASKWLHSGFAAEMQLFDSFPAVAVKLERAAKTLCSSLKRFAAK